MACPLLCNYDDYFLYLLFQKAQPFLYFCLVCLLSNKVAKFLYLFYQPNPFFFVLIAVQLSLNGFLEIPGDLLDIASNILDGLFINFLIIGHFYSLSYFVYPYFFFLKLSREDSDVLINDLALIGLPIHLFLDHAYSVDGKIFDLGQLFQQSALQYFYSILVLFAECTFGSHFINVVMVFHDLVVGDDRSSEIVFVKELWSPFHHLILQGIYLFPNVARKSLQLLEEMVVAIGAIPSLGFRQVLLFSKGAGNGSTVFYFNLVIVLIWMIEAFQYVLVDFGMLFYALFDRILFILPGFLHLVYFRVYLSQFYRKLFIKFLNNCKVNNFFLKVRQLNGEVFFYGCTMQVDLGTQLDNGCFQLCLPVSGLFVYIPHQQFKIVHILLSHFLHFLKFYHPGCLLSFQFLIQVGPGCAKESRQFAYSSVLNINFAHDVLHEGEKFVRVNGDLKKVAYWQFHLQNQYYRLHTLKHSHSLKHFNPTKYVERTLQNYMKSLS